MRRQVWAHALWVLMCLIGTGNAAEEETVGLPVIPADALSAVVHPRFGRMLTAASLDRVAKIGWELVEPEPIERPPLSGPALSASLHHLPSITPLDPSAPAPRDCREVRRELRSVKKSVERLAVLRVSIDRKLRRAERVCIRDDDCDWSDIDAELAALNETLTSLRAYADFEQAQKPDRLVEYHFHLDTFAARQILRDGWKAVGSGKLQRLRFSGAGWFGVDPERFGRDFGFLAPPEAVHDRHWIVRREMPSSRACARLRTFRMDFEAPFSRLNEAGVEETRWVRVEAISL